MLTNNFSSVTFGWVAITTGVSAILAVIFLTLMATVNQFFGTVNDVFNTIIGVSSIVLAWMLYTEHHARSPWMSQIGLVLAVVGAIFTIVGSILIIFGFTDFVLAGWYTGVGNALIGFWLAAFCYSMQYGDALPHNLVIFGLVVGAFMAIGLIGIPGIFAGIDSMDVHAMVSLYCVFWIFGNIYPVSHLVYFVWTDSPPAQVKGIIR